MTIETLKSLLEKHPEWANLPIVVSREDGNIDYIGASGLVFELTTDDNEKVLVFSGN